MHPLLFEIGHLRIYSYGVMVAAGFLVGIFLASREARHAGIAPDKILDLGLYALFFGIIGARALHVLLNRAYYSDHLLEIVMINRGGLAIQGGLLTGIAAAWIYIRHFRLPLWKTADVIVPYAALGQAIGRIGCLLNGCCYGIPTGLPFGMSLPDHLLYLHPTQIYSSAFLFLTFAALRRIYQKKKSEGTVFFSYLLIFSAGRFFIDFLRGDLHSVFLGLKTSQLISLSVFFFTAIVFFARNRKTGHFTCKCMADAK